MSTKIIHLSKRIRRQPRKPATQKLSCERLEDRTLLTINLPGVPTWIEQGPRPITGIFHVQGIEDTPAGGAIEAIAAHPTDPNIIYVGTVNGGIWQTTDATALDHFPHWEPLTDQLPSLAIGAIAFSPLDQTHNTLFAGIGHTSRLRAIGDGQAGAGDSGAPLVGLLKTTDGGETWISLGADTFNGMSIRSVLPTRQQTLNGQQVLMVAAIRGGGTGQFGPAAQGGLFLSDDDGETWTRTPNVAAGTDGVDNDCDNNVDEAGEVLTLNNASHAVGDSGNVLRYYTGVPGAGVVRTTDGGQQWTSVTSGIVAAMNNDGQDNDQDGATDEASEGNKVICNTIRIEISVQDNPGQETNPVYAGLLTTVNPDPLNVARSTDGGTTWTMMDVLTGLYSKGGEIHHFAILADRDDPNVVFVSTRTSGDFANVQRGDFSQPVGSQFELVVRGGANDTAPHPDSRDMVFDAWGRILESDDGGIYRLRDPNLDDRRWESVIGDMGATEIYSAAYDSITGTLVAGAQDNSPIAQSSMGNLIWESLDCCDGAIVQVDDSGNDTSVRYRSIQDLGHFERSTYDDSNTPTDTDDVNLVVANSGGLTLSEYDTTVGFVQPYVLNSQDATRMLIGTTTLYEVLDIDQDLNSLGAINIHRSNGKDDDGDGNIDEADETGLSPITAMAYGGRSEGDVNEDVAWVGAGNILKLRTTANGAFNALTNYPGTTVEDIVLDPDDWQTAYVIGKNAAQRSQVYRTDDSGATWTRLTGNLNDLTTDLRTVELYSNSNALGDEVLLAGGVGGVYRTLNPLAGGAAIWTEYGDDLPNAAVADLRYNARNSADVLVVGTLGRGVWMIDNASETLTTTSVLQIDGHPDLIRDETIRLVLDPYNPLLLNIFVDTPNNIGPIPDEVIPRSIIQQIEVRGFAGNDTLIVDFTNGNPIPVLGLTFTGGDGPDDRLLVLGTNGDDDLTVEAIGGQTHIGFAMNEWNIDTAIESDAEIIEIETTWGEDTFDVHSTLADTRVSIDGGFEADNFRISPQDRDLDQLEGEVSISGNFGDDSLIINDQSNAGFHLYALYDNSFDRTGFPVLNYDSISYLTIITAPDNNEFDVYSTAFLADTTIRAGAGDDVFRLAITPDLASGNLDNLQGDLTIDGGGGVNSIAVFDQGNESDVSYTVRDASIDRALTFGQIAYSSVDTVALTAGSGSNTFYIQSTVVPTTITAGPGNDTFEISPAAHLLSDLEGGLTLYGGDGANELIVNDQASASDEDYTITVGSLETNLTGFSLAFNGFEEMTVNTGRGDSQFNIESTSVLLTINAGGGGDEFNVSTLGSLALVDRNLVLDGQTGNNTLHLMDQNNPGDERYVISGGQFAGAGVNGFIVYSVQQITLDSGSGNSIFDIENMLGVPLTINAGAGADTFRVNQPSAGTLTLNGEAPDEEPGDSLEVTGSGESEGSYVPAGASEGTVIVDDQTLNFTGLEPVTVSGFARFSMVTTANDDEVVIDTPQLGLQRVSATSDGIAFESLALFDVANFTLDTGLGDDVIDLQQNAFPPGDQPSRFRIDTGDGDDLFRVAWPDLPTGSVMPQFTLLGGPSYTGDRLMIVQPGATGPVSYRQGLESGTGSLSVGTQGRAVFTGIELVQRRSSATDVPPQPSLALENDSGVASMPQSFGDRITNVSRPGFTGITEPKSIVRVYAATATGASVLLGEVTAEETSTASPLDAPWSLISQIDLNDPARGFTTWDGIREITAIAEDWSGKMSSPIHLDILLDTQRPMAHSVERVDGMNVIGQEALGPTSLIASLDVTLFDERTPLPTDDPFFHPAIVDALARDPANYLLVGNRVGQVPIDSVEIIATGTDSVGGGGFGSNRAGAVIIDGSDRDDHGARTSSANVGGWKWIEQMVRFAYTSARNTGVGVLVVGASAKARDAISSVASVLGIPATFAIASQIATINFNQHRLVYVPSDSQNVPGGISDADLALLGTRRSDIEAFVNGGGSLIALAESEAAAPYQWLGLPSPGGMIDSGSSTERLYQTPALAAAGLAISDADLNLGIPWHHHFGGTSEFAELVPFVRSVGPDGIAGNGDDRVVTLGLAPDSGGVTPGTPGQTTTVRLSFPRPLADDRYSLIVSAGITDWAGNLLFNPPTAPPAPLTEQQSGTDPFSDLHLASVVCDSQGCHFDSSSTSSLLPIGLPFGGGFPSDCAVDAADFTVDSRPEIGTFYQGSWYIDLNGNGIFDPGSGNSKNHDIVWKFGEAGDRPVVGDWDGDGFDEIGVFGMRGNMATFELDVNGNGTFDPQNGDVAFEVDPFLVGGIRQPVAGNFNLAVPGDELALLRADTWLVDRNGNHQFGDPGETILTSFRGQPISGDWGDFLNEGIDHLGTYDDGVFRFDMDGDFQFVLNQDLLEIDFQFPGGQPAVAVTGDWDADGNDNVGLFVMDRDGVVPREAAEWYLDVGHPNDNIFPGDGAFQPPPLGRPGVPADQQDIFYQFGDGLALPVAGNFDPPPRGVTPSQTHDDSLGSIELVQPLMLPPTLSASADDHANRVGPRATRLTWDDLGQTAVDGTVENRGDKDVFQFTATRGGRIAIDLTTPFSKLDPTLTLVNSKRRSVARNDNFGPGPDSHIETDVVAGQTYYVIAEGKRRGVGGYELSVDYSLTADSEPAAVVLPVGELQATGAISEVGAASFYRFTPSTTGRLEFRAGGRFDNFDSVLDVYNSAGHTLAHNDNAVEDSTLSGVAMNVLAGQAYYIRIRGRNDSIGQYELAIDWLLEQGL